MLNLESFKDSFTSKIKSGKVYGPKEFEEGNLSNLFLDFVCVGLLIVL